MRSAWPPAIVRAAGRPRRNVLAAIARAKLPRRNTGNSAEGAGKVHRISVSGGECDFDNLGIRVAQSLLAFSNRMLSSRSEYVRPASASLRCKPLVLAPAISTISVSAGNPSSRQNCRYILSDISTIARCDRRGGRQGVFAAPRSEGLRVTLFATDHNGNLRCWNQKAS